jgi:DNA-binding SARP family transcriptional activator/DNA-binding XRE family transcriptional regulator
VCTLVKRYRIVRGLTQRELADAAGVSVGALRDIEQGRTRSPRWALVKNLIAVLGIDESQLAELIPRQTSHGQIPGRATGRAACAAPAEARINILGTIMIRYYATQVPLGPARQRAVLGLLALHYGTDIQHSVLIDMLWGHQPPKSAGAMLQGYVWRLRKIFATQHGQQESRLAIATAGAGYRLDVTGDQLDLAVFNQLTHRAKAAEREGNAIDACRLYEQGLALWRGEALKDVYLLHDHPAVIELNRTRSDVVMSYAQLASKATDVSLALPYLRNLCTTDAYNEQAHAYLMSALAAGGQSAAALQVYIELRHRLRNELGISPGAFVTETHASILSQYCALSAALARYGYPGPAGLAGRHRGHPAGAELTL